MAQYKADHIGFARLMKSDEVGTVVKDAAEGLANHLRATAPRGTRVTGTDISRYADRFRVETGLDDLEQDRSASFVINDSDYATVLEVGSWSIRNPPMPMTRALDRMMGR